MINHLFGMITGNITILLQEIIQLMKIMIVYGGIMLFLIIITIMVKR